ncbi:hypothetical protein ACFSM7_10675 [Clavibacter michiganensis subsp. tessellarius]|uniref:hypothetical protein n=1 Tax=Clavibacter tessellarius TaxID=31965 RepID=UPI00363153D3
MPNRAATGRILGFGSGARRWSVRVPTVIRLVDTLDPVTVASASATDPQRPDSDHVFGSTRSLVRRTDHHGAGFRTAGFVMAERGLRAHASPTQRVPIRHTRGPSATSLPHETRIHRTTTPRQESPMPRPSIATTTSAGAAGALITGADL